MPDDGQSPKSLVIQSSTAAVLCFSKEKGRPTITPKKKGVRLGQRRAMSQTDCLKINALYGCLDKSTYHRRKYYTLCKFMGL
jgi:hypothetical protein